MSGAVISASQAHSLSIRSDGATCGLGENQYGQLGDGTTVEHSTPTVTAAVANAKAVSTGARHSLAVLNDGTVRVWGSNDYGQLGDGTIVSKLTPIQNPNLSGITAVAAGLYHSVALKNDGTVWAWGYNNYGELGDGTNAGRTVPIQVITLEGIVAIGAGDYFSVALKSDGTVWAWGYNNDGELGDGTRTSRNAPVMVAALTDVTAIAAGAAHTLALKKDQTVWAWGYGAFGQLGAGGTTSQLTAVRVASLSGVLAVTAGQNHSLAIKDGTVWAWGQNQFGQLGNRTTINSSSPIQVPSLSGVVLIAAGDDFSLAVKSDGTRLAWGNNAHGQLGTGTLTASTAPISSAACAATQPPARVQAIPAGTLSASAAHTLSVYPSQAVCATGENQYGQLGDGTFVDRQGPVGAAIVQGATSVSTGDRHSLAVASGGVAWAWGANNFGQLGDGTSIDKATPVQVLGLKNVNGVAAGLYHSLAVLADGTVWSWGSNTYGQLGDGTNAAKSTPVQVIGLSGVVGVAAGQYHSVALQSDGTVWVWGYNNDGELADGTRVSRNSPEQIAGLSEVVSIAAGAAHTLAIKGTDGSVWTWGYGVQGQLGAGNTDSQYSVVRASGLVGVVAIAGGQNHSLAVNSDGIVWAWGMNQAGQLGNRSTVSSNIPVQVGGFTNAAQVAAGVDFSFAIKKDGTRWAWGNNNHGQLGTGNVITSTVPVASLVCPSAAGTPVGPAAPTVITASNQYSLAVKSDGTVVGWGLNDSGQLGNGTKVNSSSPTPIISLTNIISVDTSGGHGLAIRSGGTVWSWGANSSGQLGDGSVVDKLTPFQIPGLANITAVAAGLNHSLALKNDGTVLAWGANNYGQLGDGTNTRRGTPAPVINLTDVVAIAAGDIHSIAVKKDGSVWAWGYNNDGELGDGTRTTRTSPVQVVGLTDVVSIAAGSAHNLAIRKGDGSVWTWGYGVYGQLGDGDTSAQYSIVRASGLTGITSVSAGQYHSLAVRNDGTAWAWGINQSGQLGNGSSTNSIVPVQIQSLTKVGAVAAGFDHSLALTTDGRIFGWGSNKSGQFGMASPPSSTVPVLVGSGYLSSNPVNSLVVSPLTYSVSYQLGGTLPALSPALSIGATLSAASFTASSDAWLKLGATSGTTPALIPVTIDPSGLSPGNYTGKILITAPSLTDSPQTVTVSLSVTGSSITLSAAPSSLAFSAQQNGGPQSQGISINSQGVALDFQVQAATDRGGNWLVVTPAGGTTPSSLTVTVSPGSLTPGDYSGNLILNYRGGSLTVPVKLGVTFTAFDIEAPALQFNVRRGSAPAQSFLVTNRSSQSLSLSVSSKRNNPWVTVSSHDPIKSNDSAYYTVQVTPNQFPAGLLQASDSIVVSGAGQQKEIPLSVYVSSDKSLQPQLSATAVTLSTLAGQNNNDSTQVVLLNAGSIPLFFSVTYDGPFDVKPTGPQCKDLTCDAGPLLAPQDAQPLTFKTTEDAKTRIPTGPGPYTVFTTPVTVAYTTDKADVINVYVNVVTGQILPPGISAAGVLVGLASQPSTQSVTMFSRSNADKDFKIEAPSWLQVTAPATRISGNGSLGLTIGPVLRAPTNSDSNVIKVTFSDYFDKNQPYVLGIQAVYVGPPATSRAERSFGVAAAGCTPGSMTGVFTSPASLFQVPATLPVSVVARVADNCGNVPASGAAMVTFSNGDAPVALTLYPDGSWRGTWQPQTVQDSPTTLRLFASAPDIQGTEVANVAGKVSGASGVPVILSKSVIGAASQQGGSDTISPGEIVSIYGSNLAAQPGSAGATPSTQVGSVTATIGGIALPLFYVSPNQVNAVTPFILPVGQTVQLIVSRDGVPSVPLRLAVVPARPGIFTQLNTGSGPGSIVDGGTTDTGPYLVDAQHPAHRGDILTIYCGGLGSVDQTVDISRPAPGSEPLPRVSGVSVIIGNNSAEVLYAGLTPGYFGLYQVNVRVPANALLGDAVPVTVSVNNVPSNGVTLAIR